MAGFDAALADCTLNVQHGVFRRHVRMPLQSPSGEGFTEACLPPSLVFYLLNLKRMQVS